MSSPAAAPRSFVRLASRLAATVGAVGIWWLVADLSPGELGEAFGRLPEGALLAALGLQLFGIFVGAMRWSFLLHAHGAERVPDVVELARIYLVGTFFNTFLPANVGGDVLRGHVTQRAFPGAASSYLIVLVERIFGLAGLFSLTALVLLFRPVPSLEVPSYLAPLGLLLAAGAAAAPAILRRLGGRLPGKLGAVARDLPWVSRPDLLLVVWAFSVATHLLAALSAWVLIASLAPTVTVDEALVLVPVATASAYLPTIAGLGAREAAFVVLLGQVGVDAAHATIASIAYLAVQLLVAGLGGLVHFTRGSGLRPAPGPGEGSG